MSFIITDKYSKFYMEDKVKDTEYAMERQCENTWAQILTLPPISHVIMEKYLGIC